MAVTNDPEWLNTMRPLQKTGRSNKRRHGVHKRRRHQQRKKARGTTTHGADACGLFTSSQAVDTGIVGQRTGSTSIVFLTREAKDGECRSERVIAPRRACHGRAARPSGTHSGRASHA